MLRRPHRRAYQHGQSPWNGSAAAAAVSSSASDTAGGESESRWGWGRATGRHPHPQLVSKGGMAAGAERLAGCSDR
jgi:hypothetical protein